MDWETKLQQRIDKLTKDRDRLVEVANQQIASINGRIEECKELLASLKAPEESPKGE